MKTLFLVLTATFGIAVCALAQAGSPSGRPPWADTTGESGLYPNGDAVYVYRAALDLLYNDVGRRPSVIVMHDTAELAGDGPCPVACNRPWPHKSRMDTTTILNFARQSPKRPRIRDFGYPIPIKLVSYDDVEMMRHDGIGYLAANKIAADLPGTDLAVAFRRKYPGAWGLTTLTKVGFNTSHTEALVQVRHWCGESCASTETLFLKRIDSQWRVVERIPQYAEGGPTKGNLRYRGPAGSEPTESELLYTGSSGSERSDARDVPAVYRTVLDSLYNFQGESPKSIVLTDRYFVASDTLPAHRTPIDRDLLQKHAFESARRVLPDIPIGYRKPIAVLPADSLAALERAGAPLARQKEIDQPMWLEFMRRYPGAWGMVGLSRVSFDAGHTMAMVYTDHACGPYCGNSDSWVLARSGERWRIVERIKRTRPSEWDPLFFPLRYVGMDAKPNGYRTRHVSALILNAVTKAPASFTPVKLEGYRIQSRVMATDSAGRIDIGRPGWTSVLLLKVGCPSVLSKDSIVAVPEFAIDPGADTTIVRSVDFRNCLSPLPWEPVAHALTGAQAFISDTAAKFVFPRRGPTYKWDVPIKGAHPGDPEFMWEVSWRARGEDKPFMLWLHTEWKAGGPREGSLSQLIAGRPLEAMIEGTAGDMSVMFADPETDRKNVFANVEDGRLVFTVRGRKAVKEIFPVVPSAVRFETTVRQVPMREYGPGDIGEAQNVFVNCHSSDSTAATRRRCDVPSESLRRAQVERPATPRQVRVVAVTYDGSTIMRNLDVRVRSEDLKTPLLIQSTGSTGTFSLARLPNDSVAFEGLCAPNPQGERKVSGSLALFIPPGNDTTVQLLVDPRRCP
jgi:hypothetical protein